MPNFRWLSSQDAPEMGDASLAALLAGAEPAEGLAPGLEPLADAVAALTARPPAMSWPVRPRRWPSSTTGSACRSLSADHAIGGIGCSPRCCPPEPRPPRLSRR